MEKKPVRRETVVKTPLPSEEEEVTVTNSDIASFNRPFRVQAGLGYHSLHSGDATNENLIAALFLSDHFALAANAEYRFTRYVGVEAEGFYAFTPTQPHTNTSNQEETRQLKELGLMLGVRAEYPIYQGRAVWRPRAVLGYGTLSETQTSGRPAGTSIETVGMSGVYFGIGIEMELERALMLFGDAAFSIGGSGGYSRTGVTTLSNSLNGPSFNRFRIGGYLRLFDPISFGVQLVYRTTTGNATPQTEFVLGQRDGSFQALAMGSIDF